VMWAETVAPKPLPSPSWLRCEPQAALTAVMRVTPVARGIV
jgi:hypothetical protein